MLLCDTKDKLLFNIHNKQCFVDHLSTALSEKGLETTHATEDTDCLIAQKAREADTTETTVLIGEDTDLLVWLLHHLRQHHASRGLLLLLLVVHVVKLAVQQPR